MYNSVENMQASWEILEGMNKWENERLFKKQTSQNMNFERVRWRVGQVSAS